MGVAVPLYMAFRQASASPMRRPLYGLSQLTAFEGIFVAAKFLRYARIGVLSRPLAV